jgi:hypothetical protein
MLNDVIYFSQVRRDHSCFRSKETDYKDGNCNSETVVYLIKRGLKKVTG